MIQEYIRNQLKEDELADQMSIKDPSDKRCHIMCWSHAKLAFPAGGVPYSEWRVLKQFVLSQDGEVEGRICHDEIGLELWMAVIEKGIRVEFAEVSFNSSMTRFICAIFHVVGLESWPNTEIRFIFPPTEIGYRAFFLPHSSESNHINHRIYLEN